MVSPVLAEDMQSRAARHGRLHLPPDAGKTAGGKGSRLGVRTGLLAGRTCMDTQAVLNTFNVECPMWLKDGAVCQEWESDEAGNAGCGQIPNRS